MANFDDLYEILGVSPQASAEEIRAAFRRQAREFHPDRFVGEARVRAEQRFQRVTEAYNTLSDEEKRKRYDVGRGAAMPREAREDPREVARALLARAAQAANAGSAAEARLLFRQAIAHDDSSARAHHLYGLFLAKQPDQLGEALRLLDRAAKLDPLNLRILLDAARQFMRAGMPSRAQRFAIAALEVAPDDPGVQALWRELQQAGKRA